MQRDITKLIGKLAKTARTNPVGLVALENGARLIATTGVGYHTGVSKGSAAYIPEKQEVVTYYSSIIITADGAFEKPPGWPTNGVYPDYAEYSGSTLPDSLTLDGSTLSLNTDVDHYEQRRVHVAYFDENGSISCVKYHVPLEEPYTSVYLKGLDGNTNNYSIGVFALVLPEYQGSDLVIQLGLGE